MNKSVKLPIQVDIGVLDFSRILNTLRVGHGEKPHLDSNVQNAARLLKKLLFTIDIVIFE